LQAMQVLIKTDDIAEDTQLAFFYTTIVYNICRSREDKVRPKKNEFPFNELGDDDLAAVEEFYEKMPAESRPVKNGEVDPGSRELAESLRSWCILQQGGSKPSTLVDNTPSSVVSHLGKCALHGSSRVKSLVALSLKYLCAEQTHRRYVVSGGGIRTLLGLVDLDEEIARDAARQTLAQVCIVTNPSAFTYSEQLDTVRPLVELLDHRHELLQFEAAMGLTNLLTVSDELRSRAIQADAWRGCRELLFSENEMLQRAGIQALCNFCMAPEILERFADGKAELEIKVFIGFCGSDDIETCTASSGALAMLASCEEVAIKIAESSHFDMFFKALAETSEADVQHRLVSVACSICEAKGCLAEVASKIRGAVREQRSKGLTSPEARALANSLLVEDGASIAGA